MTLRNGDLFDVLPELDEMSVDAVVCDPPYAIEFMGNEWDKFSPTAYQDWTSHWASEVWRVLKPGGYLLAFGGTRTYHRLTSGIEDVGFEIRDCLCWLYGQGFPKSLNVGRASGDDRWRGWGTALKPAFEPIAVARKPFPGTVVANVLLHSTGALNIDGCRIAGAAGDGNWSGSSGDRPEDVFEGGWREQRTEADERGRWPANVLLSHLDGCVPVGTRRVKASGQATGPSRDARSDNYSGRWMGAEAEAPFYADGEGMETVEAWDCQEGCPVALLDAQSGITRDGVASGRSRGFAKDRYVYGELGSGYDGEPIGYGGEGGASRFFYCTKVSRAERNAGLEDFEAQTSDYRAHDDPDANTVRERLHGSRPRKNHHPTVKPIALVRWLERLVTPPGGTVLDPFLGSGTGGIAAALEGFGFVGVERDPGYFRIAEARIAFWAEHGEDALRIVADREQADRRRVSVAESGQLDLLA